MQGKRPEYKKNRPAKGRFFSMKWGFTPLSNKGSLNRLGQVATEFNGMRVVALLHRRFID
jgi:hypothetical protein